MTKTIFFCAIGGSGMMPLALMMKAQGYDVRGSDRAHDQGRLPDRFAFLLEAGIKLYPQDGTGVTQEVDELIVSSAVEDTVSDYQAAMAQDIPVRKRADLLASLFNEAPISISVAGTSGKSTTTGMIGWILKATGQDPSIVNGAVMKNFVTKDQIFASSHVGAGPFFVAETDESDGSIALYNPHVAVLNNIAHDHKSMAELRVLFAAYISRAETAIVNLDNDEVCGIIESLSSSNLVTYSLKDSKADFYASDIVQKPYQIDFTIHYEGKTHQVELACPGLHNVSNALAAVAASVAVGVSFGDAAKALSDFKGIARRFDVVGQESGITIIDDFAHNPDKITALLRTLRQFEGRILILFQPHGYGPLRLMRDELAVCFVTHLNELDQLYITDPLYLGGTTDKSIGSESLVAAITQKGGHAIHCKNRDEVAKDIVSQAVAGDRVIVMGARDDSLSALAERLVMTLKTGGG